MNIIGKILRSRSWNSRLGDDFIDSKSIHSSISVHFSINFSTNSKTILRDESDSVMVNHIWFLIFDPHFNLVSFWWQHLYQQSMVEQQKMRTPVHKKCLLLETVEQPSLNGHTMLKQDWNLIHLNQVHDIWIFKSFLKKNLFKDVNFVKVNVFNWFGVAVKQIQSTCLILKMTALQNASKVKLLIDP